jgi:hypothetical protein
MGRIRIGGILTTKIWYGRKIRETILVIVTSGASFKRCYVSFASLKKLVMGYYDVKLIISS